MDKKTEAMKLALEALEESLGYVEEEAENAQRIYGQYPTRQTRIQGLKDDVRKHMKAITALREALAEQPAQQQEPVALQWQQSPIRTAWGDDMVVASVAIDNDHTLSLYCERDQTPKVDAMFAQRTWVGLTEQEALDCFSPNPVTHSKNVEGKLKEKNT